MPQQAFQHALWRSRAAARKAGDRWRFGGFPRGTSAPQQ